MFFTGTLQEGISKALQESKLVVCFVTDNEEESKTWEDEYLKDDTIAPSLEKDAVLLRLEAGSQEAGYLAALVPLPKNPTVVVIKNGELKEYISAGTSRDEFVRRVGGAFQAQTQAQAATEVPSSSPSPNTQAPGQVAPAQSSNTSSASGQQHQQQSHSTSRNSNGAREQADRKAREETEKRRREKGKMKEEAQEQGQQGQDPEKAKQTDAKKKAAQQLAERQRQAREERARVLKRIEDDKAERKARDEARKAERRAAAENAEDITAAAGQPAPSSKMMTTTTRGQHDQCAIQVRLFDGSTIRTRFPAQATLATDVRKWIDEVRADGKEPYTFKVILTPLPNRTVDPATEEDKTLAELGLAPSSTLVLAPVGRYSSSSSSSPAYPSINAGLTNPLTRLIAAVLAFVGGILGNVVGAFEGSGAARGRVANNEGGGQELSERRQQQQQKDRAQGQATGRDGGNASSSRINGFQNPDDRQRDHQFYNGNSRLVLAGSRLAGLELLEVPAADAHVALVLVHAAGEALGGVGAVGAPLVVLLGGLGGGLGGGGLGAGGAAEHAADGVADRGAYGDTTVAGRVCCWEVGAAGAREGTVGREGAERPPPEDL
ncbi:hypothetical protein VMCG_02123 [Cytospora schulzeri]|uniref:UBX domain-containing protein 2 n=1 Tax=Cytospora schulzeri TaxID=448051 RepID=A0A423X3B5_9PEZI|nr:hypothetical protein VMCG_02123 [Valsa malicola]